LQRCNFEKENRQEYKNGTLARGEKIKKKERKTARRKERKIFIAP